MWRNVGNLCLKSLEKVHYLYLLWWICSQIHILVERFKYKNKDPFRDMNMQTYLIEINQTLSNPPKISILYVRLGATPPPSSYVTSYTWGGGVWRARVRRGWGGYLLNFKSPQVQLVSERLYPPPPLGKTKTNQNLHWKIHLLFGY